MHLQSPRSREQPPSRSLNRILLRLALPLHNLRRKP